LKDWNSKTYDCIITIEGHTDIVFDCAFSNDGNMIVSASRDKSILWNTTSLQLKYNQERISL